MTDAQVDRLIRSIGFKNSSCSFESRPICVSSGLDCLRVYEIVSITRSSTTVLRVETHDGAVLTSFTQVPCNCDCIDEPVA